MDAFRTDLIRCVFLTLFGNAVLQEIWRDAGSSYTLYNTDWASSQLKNPNWDFQNFDINTTLTCQLKTPDFFFFW